LGGALALADHAGVGMAEVREQLAAVYDDLVERDATDATAPTSGGETR
jgi:hypothetical protein